MRKQPGMKMVDDRPRIDDLFDIPPLFENAVAAPECVDGDAEIARRRRDDVRRALEKSKRFECLLLRRAHDDAPVESSGYHFEGDRSNPSLISDSRPARISTCAEGPSSKA